MFLAEIRTPVAVETQNKILIWPCNRTCSDRIFRHLTSNGFQPLVTDCEDVIGFVAHDVEGLAKLLTDALNVAERKSTQSLIYSGAQPRLEDFARVSSIEQFMQHHSSRWLLEMLDSRRYKSVMQPIMAACDDSVHGHEFLFRGMQTDGDPISPVEIFAAAEDAHIMDRLDHEARLSALRTAARLKVGGKLFINVMPSSMASDADFDRTLEAVSGLGLDPSRIVFEIVESQAIEDGEHLKRLFARFRADGYRIALDDFGSGYNNLSTMIQLHPDYIKLDKSLTQNISHDPHSWNLVANMIDAAKQNNVDVIAEGVENASIDRMLKTLGADFLQGYFYATPGDYPNE